MRFSLKQRQKATKFSSLLSSHFCLSPALHLSSAAGHEGCVDILLRLHNADSSLKDRSGQTAQDLSLKPAVRQIFDLAAL